MKQIKGWADLEQYGFNSLTGEACLIGMRMLVDVNLEGKELAELYLGAKLTSQPWNTSVNGHESMSSLLIAHDAFDSLAIFCLLQGTCRIEGTQIIPPCVLVERGKWDYITGFHDTPEDMQYMQQYILSSVGCGLNGAEGSPQEIEEQSIMILKDYNAHLTEFKHKADQDFCKCDATIWQTMSIQEKYIWLNQFNASYNRHSIQFDRHPRYYRKLNHPGIGCNAEHSATKRVAGI